MASYDELLAAARRADAAGDAAGAKRLLEIAAQASRKPAMPQPSQYPSPTAQQNPDKVEAIRSMVLGALGRADAQMPPSGNGQGRMTRFEVQGPDGKVYEVEAPTMEQAATAVQSFARTATGLAANTQPAQQRLATLPNPAQATPAQAAPGGGDDEFSLLAQQARALRNARERRATAEATPGTIGGVSGAMSDGALFGFGDEYLAGLSAALGVQPDGQGGANWFDYSKPLGDRYGTALGAIRAEQGNFKEQRPLAALGGEIAGSMMAPGGAAAKFINSGAGTAARVGRSAVVGGAAGAGYGFGEGDGGLQDRFVSAAISAPVGAVAGGTLAAAGQGFNAAVRAVSKRPDLQDAAPTLEGLRDTAKGLYEKARIMGGEMRADQVAAMAQGITGRIREAGYDRQLHPRVAAVVERMQSEAGPKSLQEMEILRRVASNAAASLQPDERRIAMEVVDAIDDAVEGMGGGAGALSAARDTWARLRRMETVDEAINRAALTDDFAGGLRTQFKALLRNPRRLRGFAPDQIDAIRAVAMGGPVTNGLRALGKLMAPTGISGIALTGGAALSGAGLGSLAIPAAGAGMSAAAAAITRRGAENARSAAGGNPEARKAIAAILNRANPASRAPFASGAISDEPPRR